MNVFHPTAACAAVCAALRVSGFIAAGPSLSHEARP
jgi:hypothetical protein